jgi:competence protein ComEC
LAEQRGIPVVDVVRGSVLNWDPALRVEVLWPPKDGFLPEEVRGPHLLINDNSVVLRIEYGDSTFLLPGDIQDEAARALVKEQPRKLKTDVLLAPHHGLFGCAPFAAASRPEVVIVSCRLKYPQHAQPNVLPMNVVNLFGGVGARVYATCWQGTVRAESDGHACQVTCDARPGKGPPTLQQIHVGSPGDRSPGSGGVQ